jgi:hypothetical protein
MPEVAPHCSSRSHSIPSNPVSEVNATLTIGYTNFAGSRVGFGADVPRRELIRQQMTGVLRGEIADREAAIRHYRQHGRHDDAACLEEEAAVLGRYPTDDTSDAWTMAAVMELICGIGAVIAAGDPRSTHLDFPGAHSVPWLFGAIGVDQPGLYGGRETSLAAT